VIVIVIYPSPWQQVVSSLINETQGEPKSTGLGLYYYYCAASASRGGVRQGLPNLTFVLPWLKKYIYF